MYEINLHKCISRADIFLTSFTKRQSDSRANPRQAVEESRSTRLTAAQEKIMVDKERTKQWKRRSGEIHPARFSQGNGNRSDRAASMVTVKSPLARNAESAGTLPSKGDERRASAEGEKGERCYRRML